MASFFKTVAGTDFLHCTILDFEYDVSLIFKNCEKYNGAKNNIHMLTLGKYTAKVFR